MKVLIIGGAGYIGSTLTQALWQAGNEVTVLDCLLFGGESLVHLLGKPRFELVTGDVRDAETVRRVVPGHEAVILLAAIVGEPACNRDPDTAVQTNVLGAENVLLAAKAAGVKRLILSSTCSNYGICDPDGCATEQSPLMPISTYAETKVAAEEAVLAAANDSLCTTVLRLSTAFGVSSRMRFDLLVSDLTLAAMRDRKITLYGEQFWRPFVHVLDIADAVSRVLHAPTDAVGGEVFNVGSNDANMQKIELARCVQHHVPGTELVRIRRDTDLRSYRVDFGKITERLGFRARWSVPEGVREIKAALLAGIWQNPSEPRFYNSPALQKN